MATNFVSYNDAQQLMTKIGQKFSALTGAYIPKGSVAFSGLPATPSTTEVGYVYNITNDFTTDSRFVEGSGKDYPAGSNVVVVDNSTYAVVASPTGDPSTSGYYELDSTTGRYVASKDTSVDPLKTYYTKTTLIQLDVLAGFVDLSDIENAIDAIKDMIADEFDATATAYAIGDVVVYDDVLYVFTSAHTAGDPWDPTEVSATSVEDLIAAALATANTNINTAKATVEGIIADEFDGANAYVVGDVVTHSDGLYKFTLAHTAGDPWSISEVSAVKVEDLVDAAEPDSLTPAQITALEALLD